MACTAWSPRYQWCGHALIDLALPLLPHTLQDESIDQNLIIVYLLRSVVQDIQDALHPYHVDDKQDVLYTQ